MPGLATPIRAWAKPRILVGLLSLGLGAALPGEPLRMRSIPVPPAVAALSTEQLIDTLQQEAPGLPGRPWPALVEAFQPLDTAQRFGFEPVTTSDARSAVMVALISRGAQAVPLLLQHLDDARPTRLVRVHAPAMPDDGGTWFADLYVPRVPGTVFDPPVNHEVDFDSARPLRPGASYTLKVGDLCFVALGQIVNRPLRVLGAVLRGGGVLAGSTSLNSPVESPALAAAARKDWRSLTAKELEDQLTDEAWRPEAVGSADGPSEGAIQRLIYFYPEAGRATAAALLKRPLVDADVQIAVVQIQNEPTEEQLAEIARFRREHSRPLCEQLRFRLELADARQGGRLSEILRRGFPEPGLLAAGPDISVPLYDQTVLLYALAPFDGPDLSEAVAVLCVHASQWEGVSLMDRLARDQVVLECVKRLKGRPQFEACAHRLSAEMDALAADTRLAKKDPGYREEGSAANQFLAYKTALKKLTEEAKQVLKPSPGTKPPA